MAVEYNPTITTGNLVCYYDMGNTVKSINCFYVVYGERCDVDKLLVEIE